MMDNTELLNLIQHYGLTILAPLALIEGPIVSVLGGYMAGRGLVGLPSLLVVLVAADLLGDAILYGIGQRGGRLLPNRLRARLTRSSALQDRLRREMRDHGARLLVIAKLTHGAGFAVLMAAGATQYPFLRFLGVNFLATVVKSGALVALGWWMGDRWHHAEVWLDRAVVAVVALAVIALMIWLHRGRRSTA
jgi:Uncharacterized membrane-associated protein